MATYGARRNLIEGESTYELTGDRLTRTEGGSVKEEVALAEVRRVRISFTTTVVPTWFCTVETPRGRISIPSATFTGVAQAHGQHAEFRAFVQAVTSAIAARSHTPQVAFVRGGSWMRPFYFVMMIVLGVMAVLIAMGAMGALMSGQSPAWAALPGLVVVFTGTMSWRLWRGNAPAVFDPNVLPADIAPLG